MQPQNVSEQACVVCDEIITNPVCPECLESSVKTWLVGVKPQLIGKVSDIAKTGLNYPIEGTVCVLCRERMTICPHCFSKAVQEIVEEEDNPYLEEEFLTLFDYDLRERPLYF